MRGAEVRGVEFSLALPRLRFGVGDVLLEGRGGEGRKGKGKGVKV